MTSILYKIVAGFGECRKIHSKDIGAARIEIVGVNDGFLSIGELSCRLKDGVGRLHIGLLPDGEYSPLLFTEGGVIRLEKISKTERGIMRSECDTELLSRALIRLEECEERLLLIEERLRAAEAAIGTKTIL